eukprot:1416438-Amphidinium_carterae.1
MFPKDAERALCQTHVCSLTDMVPVFWRVDGGVEKSDSGIMSARARVDHVGALSNVCGCAYHLNH